MEEITIKSKKYGEQIILLDDEDYAKIVENGYCITIGYDPSINGFYCSFKTKDKNGRTKVNGKDVRKTVRLHRWVVDCPDGLTVDHINHNTLDNRKSNLRICSQLMNNQNKRNNTSGCVGVRWHSQGKKWNARIVINGKEKSLGMYNNFDEAVKARIKALKEVI